jgi:pyruvate carboxylase
MLFKCIVLGNNMKAATWKMLGALGASEIDGVETNISLLRRILQDPRFTEHAFFTRSLDSDLISTKHKDPVEDPAAQKLISFLAESLINGTQIQGQIVSKYFVSALFTWSYYYRLISSFVSDCQRVTSLGQTRIVA